MIARIRRMSFKKQIATFLTTFAALLAGIAFAAWTATGTGTGAAKAGQSAGLTNITGTGTTPTNLLYPGGSASIYMLVDNPNPFAVTLDSLTGTPTVTSDSTQCNTEGTGVTFAAQNPITGPAIRLPANSTANSVVVPAAALMSVNSGNDCQNATFTFSTVTLSGHSSS